MTYDLSAKAAEDLERIWLDTRDRWSVEQADRYIESLLNELAHLTQFPLSGRDIQDVRPGYRCSTVKSHTLYYRIQGDVVQVIRVLHQRMDRDQLAKD